MDEPFKNIVPKHKMARKQIFQSIFLIILHSFYFLIVSMVLTIIFQLLSYPLKTQHFLYRVVRELFPSYPVEFEYTHLNIKFASGARGTHSLFAIYIFYT